LFAGDELVVDDMNDVVVFESYAFGGGDVFDVGELESLRVAVHEEGFDGCGGEDKFDGVFERCEIF